MPCSDNRNSADHERYEQRQHFEKSFNQLWDVNITGDIHRCALMRTLRAENLTEFENKLYNGRNPIARTVADWWDLHQHDDRRQHKRLVNEMRSAIIPPIDGSVIIAHLYVGPETLRFTNFEQAAAAGVCLMSIHVSEYTEHTAPDIHRALDEAWPASTVALVVSHRTGKLGGVVERVQLYTQHVKECDVEAFNLIDSLPALREWAVSQLQE